PGVWGFGDRVASIAVSRISGPLLTLVWVTGGTHGAGGTVLDGVCVEPPVPLHLGRRSTIVYRNGNAGAVGAQWGAKRERRTHLDLPGSHPNHLRRGVA